ncbi:hypothetical protein ACF061_27255 [Streptomyces sp. NPDC015220]|uniref:hypothetical protein n=1 Tax=Streptomyces sp. NPDC015220 TaxID=3364947 RepID=UPI003702493D
MDAWEDDDCPWCHSLLGPGRALAAPDAERPGYPGAELSAWVARAHLVILPMATLTVVAALMMALT